MVKFSDEPLDYIGFVSAILYTLVPGIFLYQLRSNVLKEERLSIIAILCLYINGLIYFIRSLVFEKIEIDVRDFCNLAGLYLGFIYIVLYLKHFYYKTNKIYFYIFIVIILLSSITVIIIELIIRNNETLMKIVEWSGVIFNIFEYLPMGFNFIYLIKNKISEKFTLFGAFLGSINTIIWIIWAITNKENKLHSLISNIIGLLLCLLQIFIFFLFRKEESDEYKKVDDNKDNKDNNNNIDSNNNINFNNNITNSEIKNEEDSQNDITNKDKKPSDIIEEFI